MKLFLFMTLILSSFSVFAAANCSSGSSKTETRLSNGGGNGCGWKIGNEWCSCLTCNVTETYHCVNGGWMLGQKSFAGLTGCSSSVCAGGTRSVGPRSAGEARFNPNEAGSTTKGGINVVPASGAGVQGASRAAPAVSR